MPQLLKFLEANAWPLAVTSLVQFVVFLRWIYRRIRNDELMRAFVEDMATSHLPHMYNLLEKLCDKQGIERDPAPTIRWIDLNDRSSLANALRLSYRWPPAGAFDVAFRLRHSRKTQI